MPKNNLKPKDLVGLCIYQDPKKGTIFHDFLTRRSFIITNSDVKTYVIYSSMFSICVLAAFGIMSLFSLGYVVALIIFVATYILVMIVFRIFFFYKLIEVEDYTPPKKDDVITAMAKNYSVQRLSLLIVLLLLLAIMMPIYARNVQMTGINLYGSYVLSGLTVLGAIISVLALIKSKKINK